MTQKSLFGHLPEKLENICKVIHSPMFIEALSTVAKTWRKPKCPAIEDWIKKIQDIYAREHYSAIRKGETLPFVATWTDLENIMLSEMSVRKR